MDDRRVHDLEVLDEKQVRHFLAEPFEAPEWRAQLVEQL